GLAIDAQHRHCRLPRHPEHKGIVRARKQRPTHVRDALEVEGPADFLGEVREREVPEDWILHRSLPPSPRRAVLTLLSVPRAYNHVNESVATSTLRRSRARRASCTRSARASPSAARAPPRAASPDSGSLPGVPIRRRTRRTGRTVSSP